MLLSLLFVAAGMALLAVGGEFLVRGASRLAGLCRISPLVIGLTVVAFGTSSPEMAVSVGAALTGRNDLALGNVVGSNIFNVLFILGVSAVAAPLAVSRRMIRFDTPVMIAVSLVLAAVAWDGAVSRLDGVLLCGGIILYTWWTIREGRREGQALEAQRAPDAAPPPPGSPLRIAGEALRCLVGLGLLALGAKLLVDGASDVARGLGVSELVIGLTIVAGGTSLPELAASVVASLRGEREIAVGNVVGSNIFNILSVLGLSAAVAPAGVPVAPAALALDIPVMIAAALVCLPIFYTGRLIARWEGLLLLGYYAAYVAWLILHASHSPLRDGYAWAMLTAVLPLSVIVLGVSLAWGVMNGTRGERGARNAER